MLSWQLILLYNFHNMRVTWLFYQLFKLQVYILFGNCDLSDVTSFLVEQAFQVIPHHGNHQKRRTSFESYLIELEWVQYQIFYQAYEISCWQTDRDQETTSKPFHKPLRDIKHQLTRLFTIASNKIKWWNHFSCFQPLTYWLEWYLVIPQESPGYITVDFRKFLK